MSRSMILEQDRRILKIGTAGVVAAFFLMFHAAIFGAALCFYQLYGRLPQGKVDRVLILQDRCLDALRDVSQASGLLGLFGAFPLLVVGLYTAFPLRTDTSSSERRLGWLAILAAVTFPFLTQLAEPFSVEVFPDGAPFLIVTVFSAIVVNRIAASAGRPHTASLWAKARPALPRAVKWMAATVLGLSVLLQASVWGAGWRFHTIHGYWPAAHGAEEQLSADAWLTLCRYASGCCGVALVCSMPFLIAIGIAWYRHGRSLLLAEAVAIGSVAIGFFGWMSMFFD
ncbi:MAG: hypothetical protein RL885_16985 [Planctomycetota bacterium]